jgi:hypothetical protein
MPDAEVPRLSLSQWLVLCVICEKPTRGFAIAKLLAADGSLGQVWRVPRQVIYRGNAATGHGDAGRPEGGMGVAGQAGDPCRDVRSELLLKLALLDRAGTDPRYLLQAQQAQRG